MKRIISIPAVLLLCIQGVIYSHEVWDPVSLFLHNPDMINGRCVTGDCRNGKGTMDGAGTLTWYTSLYPLPKKATGTMVNTKGSN